MLNPTPDHEKRQTQRPLPVHQFLRTSSCPKP